MRVFNMKIYILHENDEWMPPFRQAFSNIGLTFVEWHMHHTVLDLQQPPPQGVFYNRMSASSHTRGHRSAPEYTLAVLYWLESHQRKVVNGSRALDLEISKLRQYQALRVAGVLVPTTQVARTSTELLHLASHQQEPFIIKPNRGGKGLGVQLVHSVTALRNLIEKGQLAHSLDGLYLVQQFIHNPLAYITRCEFIGGKFIYAVKVNTDRGFELCPADSCNTNLLNCPSTISKDQFSIINSFQDDTLIHQYQLFLQTNQIDIAGIEFVTDEQGKTWTYDVNTNTNYNSAAESLTHLSATNEVAHYLASLTTAVL
jgi:hypothetical protein